MHWKTRYFAKHAAQKALGAAPYGYIVQEFVKDAIRQRDRFAARRVIELQLRKKIVRFNAAGVCPPRIVVEQGTGWLGFDLVLFHLAGAERITTYDTRPWLCERLLRRNAEVLASLNGAVKRWRGTDPGRVDERAERLRENLDLPRPAFLEYLGVTTHVTQSMDRSEHETDSVDLFYSDSVLQFVVPADLTALVREARRFLKPSGLSFHVIDCCDMHAGTDRRIPRLEYLTYSDGMWRVMTSRYLNYQNRLRMPQFVELFDREGLSSEAVNPVLRPEDAEFARRRLARDPRFQGLSVEGIAVRGFCLKGVSTTN